jgi:hypothetical protein
MDDGGWSWEMSDVVALEMILGSAQECSMQGIEEIEPAGASRTAPSDWLTVLVGHARETAALVGRALGICLKRWQNNG